MNGGGLVTVRRPIEQVEQRVAIPDSWFRQSAPRTATMLNQVAAIAIVGVHPLQPWTRADTESSFAFHGDTCAAPAQYHVDACRPRLPKRSYFVLRLHSHSAVVIPERSLPALRFQDLQDIQSSEGVDRTEHAAS